MMDDITTDEITTDEITTDEPPAVRLTMLGDPDPSGVCADGVCYLPSAAAVSGTAPAEVRPDGAGARDGGEAGDSGGAGDSGEAADGGEAGRGRSVPSAPPAQAGDR
jgi:hypothetical protein